MNELEHPAFKATTNTSHFSCRLTFFFFFARPLTKALVGNVHIVFFSSFKHSTLDIFVPSSIIYRHATFPIKKYNSKCADNKQHMRCEGFDTADQSEPHLCSLTHTDMPAHKLSGKRGVSSGSLQ